MAGRQSQCNQQRGFHQGEVGQQDLAAPLTLLLPVVCKRLLQATRLKKQNHLSLSTRDLTYVLEIKDNSSFEYL